MTLKVQLGSVNMSSLMKSKTKVFLKNKKKKTVYIYPEHIEALILAKI